MISEKRFGIESIKRTVKRPAKDHEEISQMTIKRHRSFDIRNTGVRKHLLCYIFLQCFEENSNSKQHVDTLVS